MKRSKKHFVLKCNATAEVLSPAEPVPQMVGEEQGGGHMIQRVTLLAQRWLDDGLRP